ncbi:MAG TPA: class I SAM-dependent methyltransferase [Actinopolymorphaceae bacterium]
MPLLPRIASVRRELHTNGPRWTRENDHDFERVGLPENDCDAVRDLLICEKVSTVVEIGLAYGNSGLAIGEALATVGDPEACHLAIDAFQETEWANVGWQALVDAGLDGISRLLTERSQLALCRLLTEGFTADAAFVDGSHIFHEVFVDLYYLHQVVRPGGAVILDDAWWPSVDAAARYYETNCAWRAVPLPPGGSVDPERGPRLRAYRLPDPPVQPGFQDFRPFLAA